MHPRAGVRGIPARRVQGALRGVGPGRGRPRGSSSGTRADAFARTAAGFAEGRLDTLKRGSDGANEERLDVGAADGEARDENVDPEPDRARCRSG